MLSYVLQKIHKLAQFSKPNKHLPFSVIGKSYTWTHTSADDKYEDNHIYENIPIVSSPLHKSRL